MTKVAVFGAGSWGTAFSLVLADAGQDVTIWGRRPEVCEAINERHENTEYFPGIELPPTVRATTDPEEAAAGAEFVVLSVPSQKLRENLGHWTTAMPDGRRLRLADEGRRARHHQADERGDRRGHRGRPRADQRGQRSQPRARDRPARARGQRGRRARTRTSPHRLQDLCHSQAFRPYRSTDVLGCELGGAYKNVVALCVGMAIGLGFGDNTTASLITRGLAETARLAMKLGADPLTLMGLAGLGDLVATCSSPLSRNRTFGEKLGQGMTTEEIISSTRQVAEGAKSCASLYDLASNSGVDAPVAEHVAAVVAGEMSAQDMMYAFIARDTKHERE